VGEVVGPSSRLDPVLLSADSDAAGGEA